MRPLALLLFVSTAAAQFQPGPVRLLPVTPGTTPEYAAVALRPDGNAAILLWGERPFSGGSSEPRFVITDRDSNFVAGPSVVPWTPAFGTDAAYLDAAATQDGFMIAWVRRFVSGGQMRQQAEFACISPTGSLVNFGVAKVTTTNFDDYFLSCTGLPDGSFALTWVSLVAGGSAALSQGVFVRRFFADGTPIDGVEIPVDTQNFGNQQWPKVAGFTNGRFVVGWTENDADAHGCVARIFDATGAGLGNQFEVNALTAGDQWPADIGTDARSRCTFVITGCRSAPTPFGFSFCAGALDVRRFDHDGVPVDSVEQRLTIGNGAENYPGQAAMLPSGEFAVTVGVVAPSGWAAGPVIQIVDPWSEAPLLQRAGARTLTADGGVAFTGDAFGNVLYATRLADPVLQYPLAFQRLQRESIAVEGTVAPGSMFQLRIDSPTDANSPFFVALSASDAVTRFDDRQFRLAPDALFSLSLTGGLGGIATWTNGPLDLFGVPLLSPTFHLPPVPSLSGFTFYAAFFTIDNTGYFAPTNLRTISDSIPITIQ